MIQECDLKLYSLKDVQDMLNVNFSTVYRWIVRGEIKAEIRYKGTKKRYYISEAELDAFCIKYKQVKLYTA